MWASAGFIIGIILGSFAKALADRSLSRNSFLGRSYCPNCKHTLAWYDLFPVFSYLFLKGRCRYCRKKIGSGYLAVELVTGVLIAFLFWQSSFVIASYSPALRESPGLIGTTWQSIFPFSIFLFELLLKIFFIVVLAILFLTDLKKMLIPDRVVIPAIWTGAASLFVLTVLKIGYLYYYLSQNPVGKFLLPPNEYFQRHALIVSQPLLYGIGTGFAIAAFFYILIIITRGKGMGGGDVKLGAFMGLMLGFPNGVLALILSFLTGAVFSVVLIISGKKHFGQVIPFGPFLVLGSLIALFWGNQIIDWYLHFGS